MCIIPEFRRPSVSESSLADGWFLLDLEDPIEMEYLFVNIRSETKKKSMGLTHLQLNSKMNRPLSLRPH